MDPYTGWELFIWCKKVEMGPNAAVPRTAIWSSVGRTSTVEYGKPCATTLSTLGIRHVLEYFEVYLSNIQYSGFVSTTGVKTLVLQGFSYHPSVVFSVIDTGNSDYN